MYLMLELREVDGDKVYNEMIFRGNGNLQLKYHGAGFGVVLSSVGCMAEKGRWNATMGLKCFKSRNV
jgi:hypothetical protein